MDFRELVGGRRRGIDATILRGFLAGAELPYYLVTALRNRLYDRGILPIRRFPIPIISVGNLTLGGTGKTPTVAWLCRFFLDRDIKPGIISRGYGKSASGVNDEFLELALRLPNVPHLQNPDRVAAAAEFLERKNENSVDVLVLDDAMQHRRIDRDIDIVLLDSSEPFGFGHVFPRGTLRESVAGLRRADIVLLSRADRIGERQRTKIRDHVRKIAPDALWGEVVHAPEKLLSPDGGESDLSNLRGKRTFAFSGIGNPEAFWETLRGCGADVVETVAFPDHHRFSPNDLDRLERLAEKTGADTVLCTMKDRVKIDRPDLAGRPIQALSVQLGFLAGEEVFRERLAATIRKNA